MAQKSEKVYNSECLGVCGNYAVDIVHVPRNADDDLKENQCSAYLDEQVKSFVELDSSGNVVLVG